MSRYTVTRSYSGYVRGYETREVIANSKEEAIRLFDSGTYVQESIVRDNTHSEYDAEKIKSPRSMDSLSPLQKNLLKSLKVK